MVDASLTPRDALPPASRELFGHPIGLTTLFATEMWERFSYYGMRSLLVLYLVTYLLKPEHAGDVLGLGALRGGLEAVSGPLAVQPFASQLYGLYSGLVYLTPILGGWLADGRLGRRRTVAIGAGLMMIGHFLMASESLFLLALLFLIFGNGAFKPNISTQVGALYATGDARRDRAFSIFYVGINLGAFFSPLVCGTLGETLGFHVGFASAGVGMAIGLVIYLAGLSRLPPDQPFAKSFSDAGAHNAQSLRRAMMGIALLFLPSALFWAAYEQQGNTITLWAAQATDRTINLFGWSASIPVTWFQAFNPLMIFLFTPWLVAYWTRRAKTGHEPSTITKLSLGCLGLSLAYLVMALAAYVTGGAQASWLWLLGYFVVITLAELYFSPIGLSLISSIAPQKSRSLVMGLWMATTFAGNLFAGWLGSFWSSMTYLSFFLLVAFVAFVAASLIFAVRMPLQRLMQTDENEFA